MVRCEVMVSVQFLGKEFTHLFIHNNLKVEFVTPLKLSMAIYLVSCGRSTLNTEGLGHKC